MSQTDIMALRKAEKAEKAGKAGKAASKAPTKKSGANEV